MSLGFFIVKPVPPEPSSNPAVLTSGPDEPPYAALARRSSDVDPTTLLTHRSSSPSIGRPVSRGRDHDVIGPQSRSPSSSLDLPAGEFGIASPRVVNSGHSSHRMHDLDNINESLVNEELEGFSSTTPAHVPEFEVDIHGKKLFSSLNFWLLFSIVSLRG